MSKALPVEAQNRVAIARAGLVPQPFLQHEVYSYATPGGASVQFGTTQGRAFGTHGLQMLVLVPGAAGLNNGAQVKFRFRGNTLGLIYATTQQQPLGCRIDGVAYEVPSPGEIDLETQGLTAAFDTMPAVIVADNLSDEPHYCVLDFPGALSGELRWFMYGYLVDSAAGYQPVEPGARTAAASIVLELTAKAISAYSGIASSAIVGAVSLLFVNTTDDPVTVNLQPPGTNSVAIPISVPANSYAQFTPAAGRPVYDWQMWKVGASAAGSIVMTPIGSI